ncbi:MAG: futalosine hydrolase [Planctomycetes bacterium]|nr:futalosine hydrolase [Planctomycetota bacterium]
MDPHERRSVLFTFAHPREGTLLRQDLSLRVLETGVGKARSAVSVAAALAADRPRLVCIVGVCGAFPGRHAAGEVLLEIGDACVVVESVLGDEGVDLGDGFADLDELGLGTTGPFPAHAEVSERVAEGLGLPRVRAATVSTCSGRDDASARIAARTRADVETMESAAIAIACEAAGVPHIELRAVSNETGDRHRSAWRLGEAADLAQRLALRALDEGLLATASGALHS